MNHKRGDTFDYATTIPGTFPDGYFAGWSVAAQVRLVSSGALVSTLSATWADSATTRTLYLFKADTSAWPLGAVEFDVQFTRTSDGYVLSSDTATLTVTKDVTR